MMFLKFQIRSWYKNISSKARFIRPRIHFNIRLRATQFNSGSDINFVRRQRAAGSGVTGQHSHKKDMQKLCILSLVIYPQNCPIGHHCIDNIQLSPLRRGKYPPPFTDTEGGGGVIVLVFAQSMNRYGEFQF